MKKLFFFLLLCFFVLHAKDNISRAIIGFGGAYGTDSRISVQGPNLTLLGEPNVFVNMEFTKFEGLIGYENVYANTLSTRKYINAGYAFNHKGIEKDFLTIIDLSLKYDFIFALPLSENFHLRVYTGIGIGADYYSGIFAKSVRGMHESLRDNNAEYEEFKEDYIFLKVMMNFGAQLLLAKHHIFDFGITFSDIENRNLLTFKMPQDKRNSYLKIRPPLILSSRYIYRF